jgi:glyoxylase-like metal-dependent hydrolase (beta-lactamase superfamily II)
LSVPDELIELAAERAPVVVLTAPWHERDTQSLVTRLGVVPVFVPQPDTASDLVRKYGLTLERAGRGSPDVAWLLGGKGGEAHLYAAGERLPIGIETWLGREHNDLVLWIESRRAVVSGDTLVDFGRGLQINDSLTGGMTRQQVVARLRPLLDRPVELVLPAHGAPTDRAALERALS